MRGRSWLEGCGAGIIFTLAYTWFHISPLHTDLYHRALPMNSVYWGVAIDLAAACITCAFVLWLLEKYDAEGKTIWWTLCGAILAAQITSGLAIAGLVGYRIATSGRVFAITCATGLLLWLLRRKWYSTAVRSARYLLLLIGFAIFWILPEIVYMAVKPEPHDENAYLRDASPGKPPQRRIVWLLFDELSYDQLFNHRWPGISLPNFDRFAGESMSFSDVQPVGYYTELIIPSLLWGKLIEQERSTLDGRVQVKTMQGWQSYPDDQTLFADASRAGLRVGVAGWYIPYCRTYARELDWCVQMLGSPIPGGYSADKSVWSNAMAPLSKTLARLTGRRRKEPTTAELHARLCESLMSSAQRLIADQNIGFAFIHLPVPHPGGFYDRRTGAMGVPGSYIDNLALADRMLGQLLESIAATPEANRTTVIVSSDHSWRVNLWKSSPLWMPEDETASQGRFDPRPVLMVRRPDGAAGQIDQTPFPELKTHTLIESLIH
jgi:Sulfatase